MDNLERARKATLLFHDFMPVDAWHQMNQAISFQLDEAELEAYKNGAETQFKGDKEHYEAKIEQTWNAAREKASKMASTHRPCDDHCILTEALAKMEPDYKSSAGKERT